jgi:hypothetical protein
MVKDEIEEEDPDGAEDEEDEEPLSISGLCKEYVRMWPREVIFDATVKNGKKMMVRDLDIFKGPGVYVLYRDDIPYYIGQATRLRSRLWQHAWNPNSRHFNFWNFFSAFVVEDQNHMNDIEAILIAAMPTANNARPRIAKQKIPPEVVKLIRILRRSRVSPPKN